MAGRFLSPLFFWIKCLFYFQKFCSNFNKKWKFGQSLRPGVAPFSFLIWTLPAVKFFEALKKFFEMWNQLFHNFKKPQFSPEYIGTAGHSKGQFPKSGSYRIGQSGGEEEEASTEDCRGWRSTFLSGREFLPLLRLVPVLRTTASPNSGAAPALSGWGSYLVHCRTVAWATDATVEATTVAVVVRAQARAGWRLCRRATSTVLRPRKNFCDRTHIFSASRVLQMFWRTVAVLLCVPRPGDNRRRWFCSTAQARAGRSCGLLGLCPRFYGSLQTSNHKNKPIQI